MKKMGFYLVLFMSSAFTFSCSINESAEIPIENLLKESLDFARSQTLLMAKSLENKEGRLPKTTDRFGNIETCDSHWWVSGFFPGQLWYMAEYSQSPEMMDYAELYSKRVQKEQFTTDNHDVGFIIFCSYGNGYRITGNDDYLPIIKQTSESLSTRYRENVGCIQSWGSNDRWQCPVIVDNMMNLELLLWSAKKFNEPKFNEIAINHADKTIEHHYRSDFSSYHVVSYDTLSGDVQVKNTAQGYADESAWARGQSWGLYGYVMMARMTGEKKYLDHAKGVADYLINHSNLPKDKIPYWDYNAPNIPDCPRDVSAGTIMCSALIELSQLVDDGKKYLDVAEKQLRVLATNKYRNAPGNNGNFILKHSVGHMPAGTELDVPLSYADYYYVEALMRYQDLLK